MCIPVYPARTVPEEAFVVMILTCPNCSTQYVVKDGAIPPQGRQVRCASCKHSWHQDPEATAASEAQADAEPRAAPEDETIAEATMIEPRSGPEAEERAYEEAVIEESEQAPAQVEAAPAEAMPAEERGREAAEYAAEQHAEAMSTDLQMGAAEPAPAISTDWREPPVAEASDDEFSPFATADEVEPRPRSPIVTILIIVVAVAVLAALFYFFAPQELKGRLGLGTGAASQLALIVTHRDRQQLESGNQLLTVAGRVINPTSEEQQVPPLQAQLRSKAGKVVYEWTIPAPAPTLASGASVPFNSAEVNVPSGGDELTITLDGARD
jgi:predicted Zn finger-like uncharacterized protein